jgi:very-short-patch-repair endonuclease
MREKSATERPDPTIARLAGRQHGVVSVAQLAAVGLTADAIRRRAESGRLHRVHRGVYAVGHRDVSPEGRWMAAVLALGEGAALSHRSAAALWGLVRPTAGPADVTVPDIGGRRRRRGLRVHRSRTLSATLVTRRRGIPVTTPDRTIADLRSLLSKRQLERAIAQAERMGLPIEERRGLTHEPTRSELERRFLRLCRRHRLPLPEVNVQVGPFEVDLLWRERRLVIELDGYATHGLRSAFEADRARDVQLALLGYEVMRFTYRQVTEDPAAIAATIRALLAKGPTR